MARPAMTMVVVLVLCLAAARSAAAEDAAPARGGGVPPKTDLVLRGYTNKDLVTFTEQVRRAGGGSGERFRR